MIARLRGLGPRPSSCDRVFGVSMLDLSSDAGLAAAFLLTGNLLLGLLLGVRYNPWRRWPHRRLNYARIHDWTGYVALAVTGLHVVLLWAAREPGFGLAQVLWPLASPKQPVINTLGAGALYVLVVVVATSYFRRRMRRRVWKLIHFSAYMMAALFLVHGVLSDQTLKNQKVDLLDGEKVAIEACGGALVLGTAGRVRHELRRRSTQSLTAAERERVERAA